jgi:SAM-dependent methyltransferase
VKIKADWLPWLHAYKEREIHKAFFGCPDRCFDDGLEIGAGDGFQSLLLSKYFHRLVSTEINELVLSGKTCDSVEFRICSAEEAIGNCREASLDVVYSSNLLEHLGDPAAILRGVLRILKDDGVTVHIIPTPLWKLCQMLLYVPANAVALIEQVLRQKGMKNRFRELRFLLGQFLAGATAGSNTITDIADRESRLRGNNPGIPQKRPAFLKRLLIPQPHGVSENNFAEIAAFGRRRWKTIFEQAGFECFAIRKGPAASGYGLGWAWAETIIEKAGLATELIYIAQKKKHRSRYFSYFSER